MCAQRFSRVSPLRSFVGSFVGSWVRSFARSFVRSFVRGFQGSQDPGKTKKDCGTDLVINGVKLGEQDAINETWVLLVGEVCQSLVKLGQLVDCLVTHECLTHKKHQIGIVEFDQLETAQLSQY